MRSASLERRTVTGLVGRLPALLLVTTLLATAGGCVGWWVQRSHTGDKTLVAGRWTCSFHLNTPFLFGPIVSWAGAVAAVLIALGVAQANPRRGADNSLAEPADLALRQATIRTAFGCAITVTGGLAAGMIFVFRTLLDKCRATAGALRNPDGMGWRGKRPAAPRRRHVRGHRNDGSVQLRVVSGAARDVGEAVDRCVTAAARLLIDGLDTRGRLGFTPFWWWLRAAGATST
jgi:hypothetical protein